MRTSTLALLGLVLLSVAATLLTLNNFQKAGQLSSSAKIERTPRYILTDAQWTRLNNAGETEYTAQAQTLQYFDDESSTMLQPVISAFGGRTSPWKLNAPEGSTQAHSRDLLLNGGVLINGHWQDGRAVQITTPHLWLDTENKILRTDAQIELNSIGRKLQAKGMRADASGEQIKLLDKVQGIYEPSS